MEIEESSVSGIGSHNNKGKGLCIRGKKKEEPCLPEREIPLSPHRFGLSCPEGHRQLLSATWAGERGDQRTCSTLLWCTTTTVMKRVSFFLIHSQTTCRATFLERNPYIYILWKTNNNTRYHSFDVIITAPPNFCVRKYARVVWRSGDPIWCKALYIRLYVILVRRVYTSYNLKMSVQLSWPFCSVSFHADRAFCACTVHKLDFYSLRRIIDYVLYDVRSA